MEHSGRTDTELLRAAEDDAAAFGELYRRHVRRVYAWLEQRIAWAAADLTAETFARAWVVRHRYRDEHDGSALPWLLGIAHNVLRESARRDRIERRARERLGLPVDRPMRTATRRWTSGCRRGPRSPPRSTSFPSTSATRSVYA
jgi:DNA-directed RNA polymerase specialized sigma24 family protein